jgi:anti-sigma factor RsiW
MITLSDELLMAFADGQLDKPQSSVVGGMLRDDRELAIRVSRLQQTQAQLLDTFGALLREGGSANGKPRQAGRARAGTALQGTTVLTLSAAVALLLIGAGAGLTGANYFGMMSGQAEEIVQLPPSNWPEDIAEFHSFLTPDTLRVSAESQSNPEMVQFQLSQLFSGASVPDFSEQGLKFARGQILSYRGNKLMQLVYLGKNEPPVALYIGAGGLDMAMAPGRFGDVKTISWSENELRFVIAGAMPHQSLQALAVVANAQRAKR